MCAIEDRRPSYGPVVVASTNLLECCMALIRSLIELKRHEGNSHD
mgnify:CR=1 FL=1